MKPQMQSPILESDRFIPIDMEREMRCPDCHKLLAKGDIGSKGKMEIKCPRCKTMCRFCRLA